MGVNIGRMYSPDEMSILRNLLGIFGSGDESRRCRHFHYAATSIKGLAEVVILFRTYLFVKCNGTFAMFFGENGKAMHFPQPDPDFLSIPTPPERHLSITSQALSDVPSELIIKSRIKYGTRWSACQALMAEYSKSSSIHGIRYMFEVHRPFYEK